MKRRGLLPAALTGALLACGIPEDPPPLDWRAAEGHRWAPLVSAGGDGGFSLLPPSRTGVSFENSVDLSKLLENRLLSHGSGVALGDYDADGWTDIFLASMRGVPRLYRNLGGWQFVDVSEVAGIPRTGEHHSGATFLDGDGDGDLDLLITAVGAPPTYLLNDGAGRFGRNVGAGFGEAVGGTTSAMADVDGDGDLDVYIANYKRRFAADKYSPQDRAFDQVVQRVGERLEIVPRFRDDFALHLDSVQRVALRYETAEPDWFFINRGDGTFDREPLSAGRFLDTAGEPLTEEPLHFGLAARFHDVNGDGSPDLYVCNDFESPDRLWINDGHGKFRLATAAQVRSTSFTCMGVDFADVDRDGDAEIFTADMLSRDPRRRRIQVPPGVALPSTPGGVETVIQIPQNALLDNRGDGTFAQIGDFAGVAASEWSWSPVFVDVDLDGWEDLLISNGYRWDAINADVLEQLKLDFLTIPWQEEMTRYPRLDTRNVAFRNRGDRTFEDATAAWGFGAEEDISHGMAAADLDNDGDLDLVANRWDAPAALYRNDASAPRLAVRLRGSVPNTEAVGALIRVVGGPGGDQRKEVTAGGHYLSDGDGTFAFATGDASTLDIHVRWRNGTVSLVRAARPGRLYEITEALAGPAAASAVAAPVASHFVDATAMLGGHRHQQSLFDDFTRQPLLPNAIGRTGPGVGWMDLDGDGSDDLVVGEAAAPAIFRNIGGGFSRVRMTAAFEWLPSTPLLALPRRGAGADLVLGQSNHELGGGPLPLQSVNPVVRLSLRSASSTPQVTALGLRDSTTVGAMAAADVDGDGDVDLFVAARGIPGRYPAPADGRFLLMKGEALQPEPDSAGVFQRLGLVTAAVFSDLNGDGDPDLVVAAEWAPIRVFLNHGGHFRETTEELGLAEHTGRWNGLATGDLNGDGLPDIVATNWGRNSRLEASSEHPLELHYGDFDRDGVVDPVLARFSPEDGATMPLQTLTRLSLGMPAVRRRASTFAAFATMTVGEVVGPMLERGTRLTATTLDHMVFLNRGAEGFVPHSLPLEAQIAPAWGVVVADLDGDGNEDVFLAQNFFGVEIGSPRMDAGKGLWLRGDGTGSLAPVPPGVAGISLDGEQRGAAVSDFDGDGRLDLAVGQNGAATRLFHNRGAAPGLRVRLRGSAANPSAIGALIRPVYTGGLGPAREIQSGSGYASQSSFVQVLGAASRIMAIEVRWPDGDVTRTAVPAETREVTVRR